ncbi:fungal-specific transcription factor domain-containing protein [Lipomyces chichibuensis]|uniref:fungal-specific transcription factor domain-containing protein n=1 Tax=Lipomyces chichibuensis TaxID=1546026 RepID=UPI003342EFCD
MKPGSSGGIDKPKVKQSKSRNGCVTCKAKRLKCDETKPTCLQCQNRNVECGGYRKDFKWRVFEESSIIKRRQKPLVEPTSSTSTVSTRSTSPEAITGTVQHAPAETVSIVQVTGLQELIQESEQVSATPDVSVAITSPSSDSLFEVSEGYVPPSTPLLPIGMSPMDFVQMEYAPALNQGPFNDEPASSIALVNNTWNMFTPTIILPPDDEEDTVRLHTIDPSGPVDESSLMMISALPSLDPQTRTALFFHTSTCGVMSIKDTPSDNPWRSLFWPLSHTHAALYHGIAAMANFHAAATHPVFRIEGVDHMRIAIRELVHGLNNNMPTDVALATTLTLAFAEAWDQHISTGIAHLRGAKILIRQFVTSRRVLPSSVQQSPSEQARLSRFKTLYKVWMYIAVIAKLTSDDENETGGPVEMQDEHDIFARDGYDEVVDPLMGCAQSLFPIIGKVASLVRHVRLSGRDDIYVAGAIALKKELENWMPSPTAPYIACDDPAFDSSSCIATAHAYRLATLLYLYQCVPSLAGHCTDSQLSSSASIPSDGDVIAMQERPTTHIAGKLLQLLVSVPTSSRTCVVHIFPLLSAACEVDLEPMREIARQRWVELSRLLHMGNVDRAFDVVEEVWRRKKVLNGEWKCKVGFTHWSSVMREWGWEVLLG